MQKNGLQHNRFRSLLVAFFALAMLSSAFAAGNILFDFNASFTSGDSTMHFYARCLLPTEDANVYISDSNAGYTRLLGNESCSPDGDSFNFSDSAIPTGQILKFTMNVPQPCSVCDRTVYVPIIKSQKESSIPDSTPIVAVLALAVAVAVISRRKN